MVFGAKDSIENLYHYQHYIARLRVTEVLVPARYSNVDSCLDQLQFGRP